MINDGILITISETCCFHRQCVYHLKCCQVSHLIDNTPECHFPILHSDNNVQLWSQCKGTYACVWPDWYMHGNSRKTVANIEASNGRHRCIGKISTTDLRLVASRQYRMAVIWPGSCATVTLSPSLGADLLHCQS